MAGEPNDHRAAQDVAGAVQRITDSCCLGPAMPLPRPAIPSGTPAEQGVEGAGDIMELRQEDDVPSVREWPRLAGWLALTGGDLPRTACQKVRPAPASL